MPIKIDETSIAGWMQERYDLWKASYARHAQTGSEYWSRQLQAELPLRLKTLRILARYLQDATRLSVLDIGIGEGMFPWLLTKLNLNVIGFGWGGESSQSELERANPGVKVLSVRYDREPWPLAAESVDIVTMWETLEHVHPPLQHLFSELFRVLRPGGMLLGSTPNLANLRKRLFLLWGKSPYKGFSSMFQQSQPLREYYASNPFTMHIREFTPDEVRQFLRWAGFQEIEVSTQHMQVHVRLASERGRPLRLALVRMYRLAGDMFGVRDSILMMARKLSGSPETAHNWKPQRQDDPCTTNQCPPQQNSIEKSPQDFSKLPVGSR